MSPIPTPPALVQARCWNHPSREAVVRCPECRRFFCRECVTEHQGRMVCATCVVQGSVVTRRVERPAAALWITLALAGVLLAWLVFYYAGLSLARIPSTFHGGPG